ncbi:hypothetical protein QCA50_004874 [Cerrena zonata]|uniref:Amine oxidase domain-containing protein n=1 Tax=Cerrena zonata TaxID=2478898 RepID=A0AAW0GK03_9APHY
MPRPTVVVSVLGALACILNHFAYGLPVGDAAQVTLSAPSAKDAKVLILGGGVAGLTAARSLYDQGVTDFLIVEARHELGGRMRNHRFGAVDREYNLEVGANWVQGTSTKNGPTNPIWTFGKETRYHDAEEPFL